MPSWRISNVIYGSTSLPLGFTYNGTDLMVSHITREMNGISISCFFPLLDGDIESTTGYIIVIVEPQGCYIFMTSECSVYDIQKHNHTVQSRSFQIPNYVSSTIMASFGSATETKRKSTSHFTVLPSTRQSSFEGSHSVQQNKQNFLPIG